LNEESLVDVNINCDVHSDSWDGNVECEVESVSAGEGWYTKQK